MTVSVESWKTMIANANDACVSLINSLAESGDVDSVRGAVEAGIRIGDDTQHDRGRVLFGVAWLLGSGAGVAREGDVHEMLQRLVEQHGETSSVGEALRRYARKKDDITAEPLAALVAVGGDPFASPEKVLSAVSMVFRLAAERNTGYAERHAPALLGAMLGAGPITSLANPPACEFEGLPAFIQAKRLSVLEGAILCKYDAVVQCLLDRVPAENSEVSYQLGDRVLNLLGISISKGVVKQKAISSVGTRERDCIVAACRLINAGAEMRDGEVAWKAVAKRPSSPFEGEGVLALSSMILELPYGADNDFRIADEELACAFFKLAKKGVVDLDRLDLDGMTLLIRACWHGEKDLIEGLLDLGADPKIVSTSNRFSEMTALDVVRVTKSGQSASDLLEMLQAASAKAAINRVLNNGRAPAGVKP